jgi:hypothetical protein
VFDGGGDDYYICNTNDAVGAFVAGEWDDFGATFSSVATDVLFAQDIYADYTVNIGTENSTPVIALNSDESNSHANPYIGIGGATGFAGAQGDIFIGYNSTVPSISLGTTLKMVAGANAAATTLTLGAATAIGTGNGIYLRLLSNQQSNLDSPKIPFWLHHHKFQH